MQLIVPVLIVIAVGVVLLFVLFAIWDDLRNLLNKAINMIQSVEEFVAAMKGRVTAMESAEQSVLTLLSTQNSQLVAIRAELANSGVTPDQLSALDGFLTTLDGDTAKLTAAAVVTGTAAEGEPQPEPAPEVPALALLTTTLPDGVVGEAYTGALDFEGGVGPYTATSSPPSFNGITINEDGTVTGTPTAEADSTFTITGKDSSTPDALTVIGSVTLHTAPAAE